MYDAVLPCGGILFDLREILHQFPAHKGNVISTGHMPFCIQTTGIDKVRILHAQFLCSFIHFLHKSFLTACQKFRHGNSRIIGRSNGNGFCQICRCLGFPFFQKHLRTAHGRRVFADLYCICPFKLSIPFSFVNEQQCHNFRNTGRGQSFMTVLFIQNGARIFFHEQGAFGSQPKVCQVFILLFCRPCRQTAANTKNHR